MKDSKLRILVAASEAVPLAQAGGLGDVVGSLPLVFRDLGHQVAVVVPAYRRIPEKNRNLEHAAKRLPIPLGRLNLTADILVGELSPDVPAYIVRRGEFFDRTELYGSSQGSTLITRKGISSSPGASRLSARRWDLYLTSSWETTGRLASLWPS